MAIYTLGIDVGSTASKCVILKDGQEIVAKSLVSVGTGTSGPTRAIEEVLQRKYKSEDETLAIAVESIGTEEHPDITLFTTLDLDRDDVNHTIREAGFSAIHSIKQIVKLKEIPVLGTGKTDYRSLKTMSVN
jgi:N-acetylglucosamine kinase-like BadF-type ATPase